MVPSYSELTSFEWSSKDVTKAFEVHNPATGKVITKVVPGDSSTTEQAIQVASDAFENGWRWRSPTERGMLLVKCATALEPHVDELCTLLCMENGKPKLDASSDVQFLLGVFRFFGSLADKRPGQFHDKGGMYAIVHREPLGVVAGILPFNWPPIHCGGKTAPALAAGNCMILKPGEQAPLTVLRIVEILQTVLPKGVIQAIPGIGPEVPQMLAEHPTVKMVSLTGSTAAGKAVSKAVAPSMKKLALELGGKNAFIVFEDADLDQAVRDALEGAFFNKGEACTAASRMLVHEKVYDDFVKRLAEAVPKLRVGDGLDPKTHVGPTVSSIQQKKVNEYISLGQKEGARIVARAELPTDEKLKDGFFVQPTLFADVKRTMTIAQEEMFGPVATVTSFSSEEEALSIANESAYGLTAIIFTQNMERGMRVSKLVKTGMVWLNNYQRAVLGLPFGGVKDSGYGREHCPETLDEWSTLKFVQMPSGLGQRSAWRGTTEIFGKQEGVAEGAMLGR